MRKDSAGVDRCELAANGSGLWPELRNADSYEQMVSYVEPEKLTGFYARREQTIEEFLENNGQEGPEHAWLLLTVSVCIGMIAAPLAVWKWEKRPGV